MDERPFVGSWSDQTPVPGVEILSPSTRREDTLRKSAEYRDEVMKVFELE